MNARQRRNERRRTERFLSSGGKSNCHSCRECRGVVFGVLRCITDFRRDVRRWARAQAFRLDEMPAKDANGCPGWRLARSK